MNIKVAAFTVTQKLSYTFVQNIAVSFLMFGFCLSFQRAEIQIWFI